ncbi:MAG TPA: DUF4377 domain-containing protein [Gemmatimonadaceae bacterium]
MTRPRLIRLAYIAALPVLAACSDIFGPADRVVVMDIAPQRVACVGSFPMECLRVREHPDTAWTLFYERIEGFTFEPGFQYTVRVKIRDVPNPPLDASALSYELLAVLSKTPA